MSNLIFLDSFQFMNSSLSQLTTYLKKSGDENFEITRNIFTDEWNENKDILLRKGVFPYDYMSSFDVFEELSLPLKEKFYSKLNFEEITSDDYDHAMKVWNKFNCRNIGDYHDKYLMLDVCLLADIFQNFRKICFKVYNLEPLQFFSTPGNYIIFLKKFTQI